MLKEIKSKDNRIFKECQKLSARKYRDREGKYLIEGPNLIAEARLEDLELVFLRAGSEHGDVLPFDVARAGPPVYRLEPELFDKIAQTETSQGILAVVRKRNYCIEDLRKLDTNSNLVVLDRLQDPGNIGTIIRTAEGAGYGAVITMKGTADVFSPKTIRAAAGSVFRIPIIQVEDNRELRRLVDDLGKKLVVTSLDTDTYYFDADLSEKLALVIGNEGRGICEELMEMADIKVSIPMGGHLESLNASVAAGILMYEAQRPKRENILSEV